MSDVAVERIEAERQELLKKLEEVESPELAGVLLARLNNLEQLLNAR